MNSVPTRGEETLCEKVLTGKKRFLLHGMLSLRPLFLLKGEQKQIPDPALPPA